MKSKKLLLPTIIISAAIVAMIVYSVITSIAQKPTITEKEFPFSITYELNGKTETIEDVYVAFFTGNGGYVETTGRCYDGEIVGKEDKDSASYVLSKINDKAIILYTNFYADYLMGDPEYDYFSDEAFKPSIVYYGVNGEAYEDEQTLLAHGVKLIDWEYPEPIENTFVFSHISYLSGEVVIPLVVIAVLALVAVIIFVKKEDGLNTQWIDRISVLFNFVIALIVVPFTTIYGVFSDINGSSSAITHQIGYLVPAITILGLAASVSLRRKGLKKSSLIVQFVGPVVFALLIVCLMVIEYM